MSDATPTRTYNLGDLIELVAEAVPDRLAIVAGGTRYTFRQFDERTNQVARALLELGVEPGAKVAMYSWNRAEWADVVLRGVQGAGRADQHQLPLRRPRARVHPRELRRRGDRSSSAASPRWWPRSCRSSRRSRPPSSSRTAPTRTPARPSTTTSSSTASDTGPLGEPALGRRPLLPLHRRHHRHAQGRDVAPRGHLLRRAGRRRCGRRSSSARGDQARRVCPRTSPRPEHDRWRR